MLMLDANNFIAIAASASSAHAADAYEVCPCCCCLNDKVRARSALSP